MWKQIVKSIIGAGGPSTGRVLRKSSDFKLRGIETVKSELTGEIYVLIPLKEASHFSEENAKMMKEINEIVAQQIGDMEELIKNSEGLDATFNKMEEEVEVLKKQVEDIMDSRK